MLSSSYLTIIVGIGALAFMGSQQIKQERDLSTQIKSSTIFGTKILAFIKGPDNCARYCILQHFQDAIRIANVCKII
jgi:hypothetical protein